MRYEIIAKSLNEFVNMDITIPRFQRPSTWNDSQRIKLFLSILKNYPIGIVIISQKDSRNYLLDGRQRRETIINISQNVENIFEWWLKTYKIKKSETLQSAFDRSKLEFLTDDESGDDNTNEDSLSNGDIKDDTSSIEASDTFSLLFDIIRFGYHHKIGKLYGFSALLKDFYNPSKPNQYFAKENVLKKKLFDVNETCIDVPKQKKLLITGYKETTKEYREFINFVKFLDDEFTFKDDVTKRKFESKYITIWSDILNLIDIFTRIDELFKTRKLATIEIYDHNTNDAQKLFELINKQGTPLSAAEVMSATAMWNKDITFDSDIKHAVDELRKYMGIESNDYRNWDYPASLHILLKSSGYRKIFKYYDDQSKNITLGFKILAVILTNGAKNDNIELIAPKLANKNFIQENYKDISKFFELIDSNDYLNILYSYSKSISDITSDGIALCFLGIMYKYWEELDKPTKYQPSAKMFNKASIKLLDQLFYEYINRYWRGSSDSLIEKRLRDFDNTFNATSDENWEKLIKEILDNGTISGNTIENYNSLAPILYLNAIYTYKRGANDLGEIDHIIPKNEFILNHISDYKIINNLYNVSLLPKSANASKKERLLSVLEAENNAGLNSILDFIGINEDQIKTFSNPASYNEMKLIRGNYIMHSFIPMIKDDKILESRRYNIFLSNDGSK